MIYGASLGSAIKKSQKDKSFLSPMERICSQMPLDPEVSGMDAVILGPKDVMGIMSQKVQAAINAKHPNVCVIYLYTKEQERNLINCEYSKLVKRIDDKAIDDAVTEFLGGHLIKAGKLEVTNKDLTINGAAAPILDRPTSAPSTPKEVKEEAPVEEEFFNIPKPQINPLTGKATPAPEPAPQQEEEEVEEELHLDFSEEKPAQIDPISLNEFKLNEEKKEPEKPQATAVETMLASIRDFGDFDLLKKALNKDTIISRVLSENADFQQVQQMLEVLDQNIQTIFVDQSMSAEERYIKIRDLGLQKTRFKAQANDIIVKKTQSIFDKVTSITEEFVNHRVTDMERALTRITLDKETITKGEIDIDHLIEERTKMQVELMELIRNIIDVYKSMDTVTSEELATLDAQLPSSNSFINNNLAPDKKIFTPANTSALATSLMESLQNQRVAMSALETRIHAVIGVIFKICEQNDEIIRYQSNLIKLLKANKVEDVVVIDSMLKGVLRLYVGASNTGSTATILTHTGMQSRAANTLVVDISGEGKWEDYGVTPYEWDDFTLSRPHEALCVVKADASDPEKVQDIIREVKNQLDYYQYVNIKASPSQTAAIGQLSNDAIVVHYISDCRTSNIKEMAPAVAALETTNIAKKIILVDAPTDNIVDVVKALTCDPLTTKVIPIPHITAMKGCAISRKRPYLNADIVTIFEGAFR